MTTQITIGDRSKVIPNTKEEGDSDQEESEPGAKVKLGIRVQSLTPQQAKEFAMQPDEGVLVATVEAGGVADEAGLKPNDVILQVNKVPVHSPEELKNISSKLKPGSEVLFLVKRLDRQIRRSPDLILGGNPTIIVSSLGPTTPTNAGSALVGDFFPQDSVSRLLS